MTVIIGFNLCDRICLMADSRVSNKDPQTGVVTTRHDNMLKIEQIDNLKECVIASAGDARFAQFVIKAMSRDFNGKTIIELRSQIEDWSKRQGDIYATIRCDSMVNFLIAGVDRTTKKPIEKARFNCILDSFFSGKPGSGSMRNILLNALNNTQENDTVLEVDVNNTILFSLSIDLKKGVFIQDSKWGEVLLSGPSKTDKELIENSDIGKFEFDQTNFDSANDAIEHDIVLQTAITSTLVRKNDWVSVGGSYVPVHLLSNGFLATLPRRIYSANLDGSDTEFVSAFTIENNKFYRLDEKGTKYRMQAVSEVYYSKEELDDSELLVDL